MEVSRNELSLPKSSSRKCIALYPTDGSPESHGNRSGVPPPSDFIGMSHFSHLESAWDSSRWRRILSTHFVDRILLRGTSIASFNSASGLHSLGQEVTAGGRAALLAGDTRESIDLGLDLATNTQMLKLFAATRTSVWLTGLTGGLISRPIGYGIRMILVGRGER